MAVILVLVCSVLGFGSAVAALILFDASLFQAFALWMMVGLAGVIIALLPLLLPPRPAREARQAESV